MVLKVVSGQQRIDLTKFKSFDIYIFYDYLLECVFKTSA